MNDDDDDDMISWCFLFLNLMILLEKHGVQFYNVLGFHLMMKVIENF